MKNILFAVISLMMISCSQVQESKTQGMGKLFFDTYSKRKEVDKMLSFYSKDFQYENIVFESDSDDPKFLYEEFYGWKDQGFVYQTKETIQVDEILSNDSTIVAKGITMPYTYNGREFEGTRFVIYLELDKDKKIKKQTDWFNYPMAEIIEAFHLKNSMEIK